MRKITMIVFLAGFWFPAVSLYAAPGDLDTSFGTSGKVNASGSVNHAAGGGMALQSDGKILRAGIRLGDAAVTRYNADGSIDTATFNPSGGEPGTVTVDMLGSGSPEDAVTSVAVQGDGKIVVAGYSHDGAPFLPDHIALFRLNSDGSLDSGFGTGGRVSTAISGSDDNANAVAIDGNGKILVGGFATTSGHDFVAVRYNSDGSLDTTFNSGGLMPGVATVDFSGAGSNDLGWAMTVQVDGKIVVAGESNVAGDFDFAVARYNADGTLDTTFNSAGSKPGTATTDILGAADQANAVVVQEDGRIVLVGQDALSDFVLVRYNADGTLDTSFNASGTKPGTAMTDFSGSGGNDFAEAVALQRDGKIIVAGLSQGVANPDFALARYNTDGTLDSTFGSGGKILTDIGSNTSDQVRSVFVLDDGKILAGGDGGNFDFTLARYLGDSADLAVTKTADVALAEVGDTITYTMTVTNNGPQSASSVTLTDNLPTGVTLATATVSAGTCAVVNPVSCQLGTIASGSSVSVTITATTNAVGTIGNTASVSSLTADPNTANNSSASSDVVVRAGATGDLKSSNPGIDFSALKVGDTISLNSPDPTTSALVLNAALPSTCACSWTVTPANLGSYSAVTSCQTDLTLDTAGTGTLDVTADCGAAGLGTYSQALTVQAASSGNSGSSGGGCSLIR